MSIRLDFAIKLVFGALLAYAHPSFSLIARLTMFRLDPLGSSPSLEALL